MQTQIINDILETEKQASRIVDNSRIQSEEMLSDAQQRAASEFSEKIGKARSDYQKELSDLEAKLDSQLKALESRPVSSGSDPEAVKAISKKIAEYVATTVIE
ncbi:MAG: hypothetical protein PHT39_03250 [Sphaerochaetaceae bacterium]|jgi:F0F1-type ATP synthase membrane subunit b/b'|nr:hypothetical protein [Sphaerochaetaceae bacterium]MDD3164207.1 hypothetical protein [Sphaerochaetaceae bacterium]MDD4396574.1 hypothetical protein [Sphaerochaetaceae bacterium]